MDEVNSFAPSKRDGLVGVAFEVVLNIRHQSSLAISYFVKNYFILSLSTTRHFTFNLREKSFLTQAALI